MHRTRRWWLTLPIILILVAAACGGSDRKAADTDTGTTAAGGPSGDTGASASGASGGTGTTDIAPAGNTFGDLPWPCSKGDGANADTGTEPGVTKDSIKIATGDDAGFASAPGLNHEQVDAINALVKKCNELGGINGRLITANYYDAAILQVPKVMQEACDAGNFFLVGEGWALDSGQEEIRIKCGLPAAPTYTVSAAFAMAAGVFQGVPNPADETPALIFTQLAKLFPDAVKAVVTLGANFAATQETIAKYRAVAPNYGWTFVGEKYEYNINGEDDWTPFVKQIQAAGAKLILWSGSCLPNLQKFAQTAKQNGLDLPIVTDANHYEAKCAEANADGALNNVYMRLAFVPFEQADKNKATQDYLDLVKGNGGDISLLGLQATSSFLLWATAAQQCGATLTRQCVIDNMSKVHSWTGGGVHAETDPGGNHPPFCNLVLKLEGTGYKQVVPAEAGTYECDKANGIGKVASTPALDALKLDANRHPTAG